MSLFRGNVDFQAWDKHKRVMVKPFNLSMMNEVLSFHDYDDLYFLMGTGILDKDGECIYQGDIISCDGINYKIVYSEGSFCAWRPGRWYSLRNLYMPKKIGNAYENPSLMLNNNREAK